MRYIHLLCALYEKGYSDFHEQVLIGRQTFSLVTGMQGSGQVIVSRANTFVSNPLHFKLKRLLSISSRHFLSYSAVKKYSR